ncbi:MAG: rane-associated lipoprotein involved in thiamine biosynthesis [Phycisphaerales bacterium]|nr:rane-associated lipoprotein involved in thiamine biosynthesis [Phycisphaerales bacterium]
MGGAWSVKLARPLDAAAAGRLAADVQAVLDALENQLSTWRPRSDLSRFNASPSTDWFSVSPDLAAVVVEAQRASADTDGAFDVTVGPLVNVWGFGPRRPTTGPARVPTADAVESARADVGYALLEGRTSPPAMRKGRPSAYVDLSAIGKGYAADRVAAALDAAGVADYLISVGGEVRARGSSALGKPWRVGVEVPTPDVRRVLRRVELRDAGLSTSGDYRNFFDAGGHRYAHEIDPRTGRPVENGVASVSVVDASSARADALATALFVLGPDAGMALARSRALAAMFVLRGADRFDVRTTPEFERLLLPPE